jgi:hypothetical protein
MQFRNDNGQVYHLFKDLLTKTEGATWFEKVNDGDGRSAHLLLREHYVGEAHDMRRAASATANLETLFWKNEASFSFEKFLTRMSEAFKELEDAGQPLYEAQKVQHLLKSIKNDDIQVQTTLGIIRDRYLNDFDGASLTLSRTISTRFANIEPMRNKRNIGAVHTNQGRGRAGRGRSRSRHSNGRGTGGNRQHRVTMNGVDVTDVTRNYTSDEWDKLRQVGGHTYVYQRREFLSGRTGRGDRGRGGNRASGRSFSSGHYNEHQGDNEPRAIAAANTNTTDIVEYRGSTSTISTPTTSSTTSDRGGRSGGRFGPRRN